MKKIIVAVVVAVLWAGAAQALPVLAHRARNSVVRSVDVEKHLVLLEAEGRDEPTDFVVQEGRTRLRCDDRSAELKNLKVGQKVRLYYKREHGENVATEIAWNSLLPSVSIFWNRPSRLASKLILLVRGAA